MVMMTASITVGDVFVEAATEGTWMSSWRAHTCFFLSGDRVVLLGDDVAGEGSVVGRDRAVVDGESDGGRWRR